MNSIVSYPDRGNYGKSNYRGNCSGKLVKDLLEFYKPNCYIDVFKGSGTSDDVVKELNEKGANIEYFGLDLHSGFNAITDSIADKIGGKRADYIFLHPAYHNLIEYSGSQWGTKPHPADLSRCADLEDFLTKMRLVMQNAYDALSYGSRYSVLVGDIRKAGEYTSLQALLQPLAPGKLDSILIKTQHNCVSDRKNYGNANFIPISHEYLLTFKQDKLVIGFLDNSLKSSNYLGMLSRANWKATILYAFQKLGKKASLSDIYAVIAETEPDKIKERPHWRERVRCELQRHFTSVEKGVWAVA